jgi:formate hydrogenlyase transcriptional activator
MGREDLRWVARSWWFGPVPNNMASRGEESLASESAENVAGVDFEKFLGDLSAAFIRISVEEIDGEIERWLQRIVHAMDVDRGTVMQVDLADGVVHGTHQSGREGVSTPYRGLRVNAAPLYPWLINKVFSGETVVFSRLEELPQEAFADLATARITNTKSGVIIPLRIGGVVVGAVAFGTVSSEKGWSQKEVQRLNLVAEIFGNALERKRVEAKIRSLAEELRQVSQVVTMGELTASLAHELNQPLPGCSRTARSEIARP